MPDPVAPDVPVQPQPISTAVPDSGSPATPTLAPQPSMAAKVLGAISDALGGKSSTTGYTTDASGKTTPVVHENTRGDQIRNIIGSALRGASAGAQVKGPNAGIQGFGQGFQAQQQFGQQQDIRERENANKDFEQQQRTLLNQATIANYNNQTLLERRRLEDTEGEEQNKLLEAQNTMSLALAKADAQPVPVIVNGEDINGKPGNEAEMMKYFSDPNNHKAPEGYALAYTYAKGPDGKIAETVHQVPIENAKQTLVDMPPALAASLGIKSDQAPKLSVLDLAGLQAKVSESSKNKAESFKANAEGNKANADADLSRASIGALGTGANSNLSGDAYLNTLPPGISGTVKAIGEGRETFASLPRGKEKQLYVNALNRAYPGFDESKVGAYEKMRNDFTSGKTATGINSYNTSIAHLGTMFDHVSGSDSLQLNNPVSDVHRQLELDKQLVSTELAKAVSNGQMTEGEKKDILSSISGMTVSSYQTRIKEAVQLLEGKLGSYKNQWENGMPTGFVTPVKILSPQSEQTIQHISGGGQAPPQGSPVYVGGQVVGYSTDGKTMTPVGK